MLPLYPALAILAAYAVSLVKQRVVFGALVALLLVPTLIPTIHNAVVMGREDTRTETRDWLVAHVPQGTKVSFEPIAPSEWYGVTPGGGAKADPRQQWARFILLGLFGLVAVAATIMIPATPADPPLITAYLAAALVAAGSGWWLFKSRDVHRLTSRDRE